MHIETVKRPLSNISADNLLLFLFKTKKGYKTSKTFDEIDALLDGSLSKVIELEKFEAKEGEIITYYPSSSAVVGSKILIVGLGEEEELTSPRLRKIAAGVAKKIREGNDSVAVSVLGKSESSLSVEEQLRMIAEGFLYGTYTFGQYKKNEKNGRMLSTLIFSHEGQIKKELEEAISLPQLTYNAVKLARDLVNEQAAVATPTMLANIAQDIARSSTQITCEIYDRKEAEKMGMNAFLGVARAADTPPKFIYLHYLPKKTTSKRKLALVGKGITFDTGGVSIKPEKYMTTMKSDMSGAAAVLGVFSVIATIEPDFEVIGLIAATPNLVSGSAYVPGDVLKALNGKTIEVLNTDAEGRVTMADSLSFAVQKGATEIIDLATLTGACMVALGTDYAALYSNNEKLKKEVLEAASRSGDKMWEMPLVEEYRKLNKSEVADIANLSSSPWGGSITAALFLQEFVDNVPWVHLDIAGPAFAESEYELGPKGGTGYGVELLIQLLKGGNKK